MYLWRKMNADEKGETLRHRRLAGYPLHSPPHLESDQPHFYHLTAACYSHASLIGRSPGRVAAFESSLLEELRAASQEVFAWCVLPNHWHALVKTSDLKATVFSVGRLHGRTSRKWNLEDETPGRKCWCPCADRRIRSEPHFWATVNYIHNNPVHHRHAKKWQEWPHSSASRWLGSVGLEEARRIWRDYPLHDYGNGWDDPEV